MSAPGGDERPSVSRLLYRLPPFLSPPPSFPSFSPLYLAHFPLSPSLAFSLSPTYSISSQSFSFFKNLTVQTHTHTRRERELRAHTLYAAGRAKANLLVQSQKLKFYSNECLLLSLPRCAYLSPVVHVCAIKSEGEIVWVECVLRACMCVF